MKLTNHKPKIYFIAAFLFLAAVGAAAFAFFAAAGSDHVRSNIYFQGESLRGKTYAEAAIIIEQKFEAFERDGLRLSHAGKQTILFPIEGNIESGLVQENFKLLPQQTLDDLRQIDRNRIFSRQQKKDLPAAFRLDEEKIGQEIRESFSGLVVPAQDAYFYQQNGRIAISPEKIGQEIRMDKAISEIKIRLAQLDRSAIPLQTATAYPQISRDDLTPLQDQARLLAERSITLSDGENRWNLGTDEILPWISIDKLNRQDLLEIDGEKIKQYLRDNIASSTDVQPQTPRFEVDGNKIENWQPAQDGRQLEIESTANKIIAAIQSNSQEESLVEADIAIVAAQQMDAGTGLSIKEIIGTGHSNFAGSSSNRRHNIRTGAEALHGLLIKPDEEFSLIGALGEIDAANGYVPELVIKGDKTIPEYGGGLCQIGTTAFRTALASGLPITERRNHSYRVSYYEPAGTDATIYDPAPDFKFVNDTGSYVLIQARIEGDDIYFDFWGTSDGREATTTQPVIYNIVKPDPTKIIYTTDLAPGEKKCTESSHNGADAYFDYTVTYPATSTDAEAVVKERRFSSHYVPWQAVCLIGTSTPETIATSSAETATSTVE